MIEIIRKGSPKKVEETCKRCGSLFSFERDDLLEEQPIKHNKASYFFYIKCPVCNEKIKYYRSPFKYDNHVWTTVYLAEPIEIEEGE